MKEIIVAPSILSADFSNLEAEINRIKMCGAKWAHVDVMDGHFVPNITIGVPVVKSIRQVTDLILDVHLMIENPERYIEAFSFAGADIITVHYETVKEGKLRDISKQIKHYKKKAGLAIKPRTDINLVKEYLKDFDLFLPMTVEPGFSGQRFMDVGIEKLKELNLSDYPELIIEADGGVNNETAKICKDLGVTVLVTGNYVFKSEDMKQAIENLRENNGV